MYYLDLLLPTIEHFRLLGYWIVFLLLLFDSIAFIGLLSPGTVMMVGVGFLSAQGFLDIGDLMWFAVAGAVLGDLISYYAGQHTSKKFFSNKNKIFKTKYLKVGESFFNKYGNKAIFIDRFVGPVRPVATFVAGMSGMDKNRFILWSFISSLAWVVSFSLMGYFFGQMFTFASLWSTRVGMFIGIFALSFIVFYLLRWMVIKRGKPFLSLVYSIWLSIKKAVIENPDVRKFVIKHATFFNFLTKRLDKNKFSGLPTTLLVGSFLYILSLLGGLIEDVVTSGIIVSVDTRVTNLFVLFRDPSLTQFFLWVTLLGRWQVVGIFLVITIVILWIWRQRVYILPLLITIIGAEAFTTISKVLFHRSRPDLAIYVEKSFSFPSGHATLAVAFYGFLAYILFKQVRRWRTKINVLFISFILVGLIGLSRLYLGVHYLSDVLGGYLVGATWVIIGISITEWISSRREEGQQSIPTVRIRLASIALIILLLISYILSGLNYRPLLNQPTVKQEILVQNVMGIFTSEQIKYTETLTGERQEPLSFVILAKSNADLIDIFEEAGWYLADNVSLKSLIITAEDVIMKKEYLRAPMTPSFWDSRVHTLGFEKPTQVNNIRQRHHARFWGTNYKTPDGMRVYVGIVSLDEGMKWGGLTHKISPDIDTERNILFNDLINTKKIVSYKNVQLVKPTLGQNFTGDPFFTDGKAYILKFISGR